MKMTNKKGRLRCDKCKRAAWILIRNKDRWLCTECEKEEKK